MNTKVIYFPNKINLKANNQGRYYYHIGKSRPTKLWTPIGCNDAALGESNWAWTDYHVSSAYGLLLIKGMSLTWMKKHK